MGVRAGGVPSPPEQVAKGRVAARGDSPQHKCQHQGLPELHSQPHCTAGSPKGLLAIGCDDGPERWDIPMGHARPPSGQTDISILLRSGACSRKASFARGSGAPADHLWLKTSSGEQHLSHLLLYRQESQVCPPKPSPREGKKVKLQQKQRGWFWRGD